MNLSSRQFPKNVKFLAELRLDDLQNRDHAEDIILFHLGPLENHGSHLPAGTDIFITKEIAERLAIHYALDHPHAGIFVYPAIPIAGASIRGIGSVKVSSRQIGGDLYSLSRRYMKQGFRRFVFLSVHGGVPFVSALDALCRRLNRKGALAVAPLSKVAFNSFAGHYNERGRMITDKLPEGFDDLRHRDLHGGCWETSMMLASCPDLVGDRYRDTPDLFAPDRWWLKAMKKLIMATVRCLPLKAETKEAMAVGVDVGALDLSWIIQGRTEGYHGSPSRANVDFGNALIQISVEDIAACMHDVFEQGANPRKYRSGIYLFHYLKSAGAMMFFVAVAVLFFFICR